MGMFDMETIPLRQFDSFCKNHYNIPKRTMQYYRQKGIFERPIKIGRESFYTINYFKQLPKRIQTRYYFKKEEVLNGNV
jgi:hypothetical protein